MALERISYPSNDTQGSLLWRGADLSAGLLKAIYLNDSGNCVILCARAVVTEFIGKRATWLQLTEPASEIKKSERVKFKDWSCGVDAFGAMNRWRDGYSEMVREWNGSVIKVDSGTVGPSWNIPACCRYGRYAPVHSCSSDS